MQYLESHKCIHCDVRAANILVGDHHVVKVANFELARFVAARNSTALDNEDEEIWQGPEGF